MAVRQLVKNLHQFSYASQTSTSNSWSELKLVIIPRLFTQLRLLEFLKHCMGAWPLDASFRFVLELWLSYIQPWRYAFHSRSNNSASNNSGSSNFGSNNSRFNDANEDENVLINANWESFIRLNFAFYSQLFPIILQRFLRMEFTSSRNSILVYRVAKVFASEGFLDLVENAIGNIVASGRHQGPHQGPQGHQSGPQGSLGHHQGPQGHHQGSPGHHQGSPGYHQGSPGYHQGAQQESEGHSNFFSPEIFFLVSELKKRLKFFAIACESRRNCFEKKSKSPAKTGFLAWISPKNNEMASEIFEEKRTKEFLDAAEKFFSEIFGMEENFGIEENFVEVLKNCEKNFNDSLFENENFEDSAAEPDYETDPETGGIFLSFLGRNQLQKKIRKPNLNQKFPEDLAPIKTNEFGILVRFFHQISCKINDKIGIENLHRIYGENSTKGKIFRRFFQPPTANFHNFSTPNVRQQLPPRISFRIFARRQIFFAFFFLFVFSKFFPIVFSFIFWFIIFFFVYFFVQILMTD